MRILGTVACVMCIAAATGGGPRIPKTTAVHADALLEVQEGRTIKDAVVIVAEDRIVYAGPASGATAQLTASAERVDLGHATMLPGLVDAHVHLTLGGVPADNARATLEAGFTTVQDLGAADQQIFALRDEINAGRMPGPRVLAAGRWIGVKDGTCEFNGLGISGAAAFRDRVAEEVRRGADVIKVCVSGWLADARRDPPPEISDDELRAAVTEAHRLKRRVAVHAIGARAIATAVRMGADLVVHGGFVDAATIQTMRTRSVYLLPTLLSFNRPPGNDDVLALQAHLRIAIKAGLPVAFGTDAGVIRHGNNAREFPFLRDLGLPPIEVVRTATMHAAAALKMAEKIGTLRAGAFGDVIAVEGDPLGDVTALQRVVFVMSRGVRVKHTTR